MADDDRYPGTEQGLAETEPVGEAQVESDVFLDVPTLKVEEIDLEVEDVRAHIALQAEVLDLVKLNAGADVTLGKVKLDIKGVEAQAMLKVRLDNVRDILRQVLATIDRNPEILERVGRTVEGTASSVGRAAADTTKELGTGVGSAAREIGGAAGEVASDVGDAASGATDTVRDTADHASDTAGKLTDRAGDVVGGATDEWTPPRQQTRTGHHRYSATEGDDEVEHGRRGTARGRKR